jgi:hypothetical protein
MGGIFTKTEHLGSLGYDTVGKGNNYEIRMYKAHWIATTWTPEMSGSSFRALASYIGVISPKHPQNDSQSTIAMMKPVLMYTCNQKHYMEFVLPYKEEQIPPKPSSDKVQIRKVDPKLYAALPLRQHEDKKQFQAICQQVERDGFVVQVTEPFKKAVYQMPILSMFGNNTEVLVPLANTEAKQTCIKCGLALC